MSSAQSGPNDTRLVSLADEKKVEEILGATVLELWRIVNTLTRLRPSKRERYRVAIFGSAARPARLGSRHEEVKRAAAAFASLGCDVVTGGGPGLMQAANEGAMSVGQQAPWVSGSSCPSSRTSIRLSSRPTSTRRSSRAFTTS